MKSTITAAAAIALAAGSIFAAAPASARPHITYISVPAAPTSRNYATPRISVRFTGVNLPRVVKATLRFKTRIGFTIKTGYVRTVRIAFLYPIEDPESNTGPLVFAPGSLVRNPFTKKAVRRFPPDWWTFNVKARALASTPNFDPVALCRQQGGRDGGRSFEIKGQKVLVSFIVLGKDSRGHLEKKIRRATQDVIIECDPNRFRSTRVSRGTRTTPKKPTREGRVVFAGAQVLNNGTRRCPTKATLRITVRTENLGAVYYRVRRHSDNHAFAIGTLTGAHVTQRVHRNFTFVRLITSDVRQTHTDAYRVEVLKRSFDARTGHYRYGVVATSKWSRARIFCKHGPQLGGQRFKHPRRPKRRGFRARG